jgi:hypothetical protein
MSDTHRRYRAIKQAIMQFYHPRPQGLGRGCLALMLSVVYHGRALPLCWVVVKGKKGTFSINRGRQVAVVPHTLCPNRV